MKFNIVQPGVQRDETVGSRFTAAKFSLPLSAGIAISSWISMARPDFYHAETLPWQIQSKGQDIVDLFIAVPALLLTSLLVFRGYRQAMIVWAGVNLYLFYTYLIYCFDVHFNSLFLLYCLNLGLSFYSLVYVGPVLARNAIKIPEVRSGMIKTTSVYFIALGAGFYMLWLSQIVPWIGSGEIPQPLAALNLPTNPVHVIDLSLFLPAILLVGWLGLKKDRVGILLAPTMLTFLALMSLTIALLNYMLSHADPATGPGITWAMSGLTVFSLILLSGFFFFRPSLTR